MGNENRPHSRQKTVGNGSANVGRGNRVNTGSRPVGSGGRGETNVSSGRPTQRAYGRPASTTQQSSVSPIRLNFKTILILIVFIVLAVSLFRCLGGSDSASDYSSLYSSGYSGYTGGTGSSSGTGTWSSSGSSTDSSYSNGSGSYWGSGTGSSSSWSAGNGSSWNAGDSSWSTGGSSWSTGGSSWSTGGTTGTSTDSATYTAPDMSVSKKARDRYYEPAEGDTVTVMIYMCGTDLESKYGMATKDLNEMVNAGISGNVNLIIETGGCKQWRNSTISSSCNQIYKLGYKSIECVEKNFGNAAMTDPDNLTKFIDYCEKNYPADRRILIFWDHGGGSLSGYGYDEKFANSSSMTLGKIDSALKKADCTFDFIGFDACLMATLETDLVCNNYADYMIASEESEPGTGWYYTNWLTQLSNDTSVSTVELAQTIIDDFVSASCSSSPSAQVTLSVVDLAELDGTIPDALSSFASSTNELISSDEYKTISDARAGARQFAQKSRLNQVDLIDFAQRIGTDEAKELAEALRSCVKYNKTTISRSYGISIYFPYETTSSVKSAINSYNALSEDEEYAECLSEYTKCIQSFASLEYAGQVTGYASSQGGLSSYGSPYGTGGAYSDWSSLLSSLVSSGAATSYSSSPIYVLSGTYSNDRAFASGAAGGGMDASSILTLLSGFNGLQMPSEYSWVDTGLIASNADNIAGNFIDPSRMTASIRGGHKVLNLTDSEWSLIETVELNVFVRDGNGYIDLGLDNTFDWLDNDSILLEYDGTWLTLNGNVCAYYLVSDTQLGDGSWVTVGRIPARLNGEFVNLQVVFDSNHPEGTVTGAYPMYEDSGIDVQAKGNIEILPGDTIELLCDYYDLDGNYSESYTLGASFTVPNGGLELYNLRINTGSVKVTYRLTDIYGNHFWVPAG